LIYSAVLARSSANNSMRIDKVAFVLFETLFLLVYFALLQSGNQAVLHWGKNPTILHK
jgi:hypothetical protein